MRLFLICCLLLISLPSHARDIAGVVVQETLQADGGTVLQLNGAGIRSKFIFDIYIAGLYVEHPTNSADEIIGAPGRKRLVMYFLYDKVEKEKLVSGWDDGFAGNSGVDDLVKLQDRIDQFNSLFVDVNKNDVIELDFVPGEGTVVTIADEEKGTIVGKDFNDALLRIWLGDKPVAKGLKKKLLGYKK